MMKNLKLIIVFLLGFGQIHGFTAMDPREDPIAIGRKIIEDEPIAWSSSEYEAIRQLIGSDAVLGKIEKNYLLLQSPWLGTEYLQGAYGTNVNSIPVEQLLDLLNMAANSPLQTSKNLAKATLKQAFTEYNSAFNTATDIKSKTAVDYEEAIDFLNHRFGYLKIKAAQKLLTQSTDNNEVILDKKTSKNISDRFKRIRKQYAEEIPLASALEEIKAFYTILEEVVSGLARVKSYTEFTQTITELNEVQLRERKHWRSGIEITYPTKGSVWTIPGAASIEWETKNLPKDKTIKFYLLKNNTVIQELGVYKNNALAEGIKLNKTLPPGSNYKIMGIELFPADKFHTAKFATPYFTIIKKDPELIPASKAPLITENSTIISTPLPAANSNTEIEKSESITVKSSKVETVKEVQPIKESNLNIEIAEVPAIVPKRTDFDGRSITYVQELEVNSKVVQINLWDHGRQDGDIVSIYLNGYAIVDKHHLTYQKKGFELKLDPTQPNDLFLYAHNLGKFPPNTVSIEIIDGENSENIILNSDLSRCEAVLINVRE